MNFRYHTIGIAITLGSLLITSSSSRTQVQVQPTEATKTQLQPIVKQIIAAWDKFEGRRVFALGDTPSLIPITGTDKAKLNIGKMFFRGRYNDPSTLADIANAIVYYGNIIDTKVPAEQR